MLNSASWVVLGALFCGVFVFQRSSPLGGREPQDAILSLKSYSGTMTLHPNVLFETHNLTEVHQAVAFAVERKKKLKVVGSLWSWQPSIGDAEVLVKLAGNLSSPDLIVVEDEWVHAPAGVRVSALYERLDSTHEVAAIGGCYDHDTAQTLGGLVATNTHHSGQSTMCDVLNSVTIVQFNRTIVAKRDDPLFHKTVGGAGFTGVITHVNVSTAPRLSWTKADLKHGLRIGISLVDEATSLINYFKDQPPNTRYAAYAQVPVAGSLVVTGRYESAVVESDSQPAKGFHKRHGDLSLVSRWVQFLVQRILDTWEAHIISILALEWFAAEESLQYWSDTQHSTERLGMAHITKLKHMEAEWFLPVDKALQILQYVQDTITEGDDFPKLRTQTLYSLRFQHRVMCDASPSFGTDVVCLNFDSYLPTTWAKWRSEVLKLEGMVLDRFPDVRIHKGKFGRKIPVWNP